MRHFHLPWYCLSAQVGPGLHATILNNRDEVVGHIYGQNSVAMAALIVEAVNGLRGGAQVRVCQLAEETLTLPV